GAFLPPARSRPSPVRPDDLRALHGYRDDRRIAFRARKSWPHILSPAGRGERQLPEPGSMMLRFLLRRRLLVMTFFLIRVVPADPAAALAGENATPAQIAEIRRQYGLDRPLYVQFAV